jgi:hypothetical protein
VHLFAAVSGGREAAAPDAQSRDDAQADGGAGERGQGGGGGTQSRVRPAEAETKRRVSGRGRR